MFGIQEGFQYQDCAVFLRLMLMLLLLFIHSYVISNPFALNTKLNLFKEVLWSSFLSTTVHSALKLQKGQKKTHLDQVHV